MTKQTKFEKTGSTSKFVSLGKEINELHFQNYKSIKFFVTFTIFNCSIVEFVCCVNINAIKSKFLHHAVIIFYFVDFLKCPNVTTTLPTQTL